MGLFDFLQPGWKKDADKAAETIRKSDNIMMILKVLDESVFSGKDREKLNAAAVSSLSRISQKHREAADCLESFAMDGESPLLRCQAARALIERPGMREILIDNIEEAYADPCVEYAEKPEEWISWADGNVRTIVRIYSQASGNGDFRKRIPGQIKDQNILTEMILMSVDGSMAMEVMDALQGSESDYIRIAEQCRFPECVKRAVPHIKDHDALLNVIIKTNKTEVALSAMERFHGSKDDYEKILLKSNIRACREKALRELGGLSDSLISLAMEKNPRVVPELVSMYDPKDLPALADKGIIPAAEKLVESDPEKYFERYEEILPLPAKKRAVDKLIEQDLSVYGKKYADKYWSLLSESNMKKVINAGLFSKESLVQIAMGESWLAKKAADLLPKSSLAKVRESKNSDVALIGKAHYYADLVRSADEKELLEIMDWALQNESDPKLYLKALHRLKSQESLLKVLNDYFFSPKQQKSNTQFQSWEPVWTEILNCITDGPGLAAFCLEQSELLPCESFIRLKKLILGTDAEEQFIQGIVQKLMSHDHWWFWTRLLRDYYDSPRAAGAAWKFGGPELIQRILDLLEREFEVDRAKDLGSVLQFIYKNVPESHSVLNGQNGRRYEKHLICIDSWCAGRSRTIDVDYMLNLD